MISNSLLKSTEVKLKIRQSRNVYKNLSVQRGGCVYVGGAGCLMNEEQVYIYSSGNCNVLCSGLELMYYMSKM